MSLAALVRTTRIDTSSVHRVLQSLIVEGWVIKSDALKEYAIGPAAIAMIAPWHPINAFRREVYPHLERLRAALNETVSAILFVGTERVLVDSLHSRLSMSPFYDAHLATPLQGSASGKLLLLALPEVHQKVIVGKEPFHQETPATPTTWKQLKAQLEEARSAGYVCARDETFDGLTAMGAPIIYKNLSLGCLVLTTPTTTITPENERRFATALIQASKLVSSTVPSLRQIAAYFGPLLGNVPSVVEG